MKVQIMGSNECRTSLTDDVFEAIKPQDSGALLRIDFPLEFEGHILGAGRYQMECGQMCTGLGKEFGASADRCPSPIKRVSAYCIELT